MPNRDKYIFMQIWKSQNVVVGKYSSCKILKQVQFLFCFGKTTASDETCYQCIADWHRRICVNAWQHFCNFLSRDNGQIVSVLTAAIWQVSCNFSLVHICRFSRWWFYGLRKI